MEVELFYNACEEGNLKKVIYLCLRYKFERFIVEEALEIATSYENLKIIKFLERFFGIKSDFNCLESAVLTGNFKIVKYFVKNGVEITNTSILYAEEEGHHYIAEYLRNKIQPKNANTFLTLTNTGNVRRGLLKSFRPKKERPRVPPEIAKKIMSFLEFGRHKSRKRKSTLI